MALYVRQDDQTCRLEINDQYFSLTRHHQLTPVPHQVIFISTSCLGGEVYVLILKNATAAQIYPAKVWRTSISPLRMIKILAVGPGLRQRYPQAQG